MLHIYTELEVLFSSHTCLHCYQLNIVSELFFSELTFAVFYHCEKCNYINHICFICGKIISNDSYKHVHRFTYKHIKSHPNYLSLFNLFLNTIKSILF